MSLGCIPIVDLSSHSPCTPGTPDLVQVSERAGQEVTDKASAIAHRNQSTGNFIVGVEGADAAAVQPIRVSNTLTPFSTRDKHAKLSP